MGWQEEAQLLRAEHSTLLTRTATLLTNTEEILSRLEGAGLPPYSSAWPRQSDQWYFVQLQMGGKERIMRTEILAGEIFLRHGNESYREFDPLTRTWTFSGPITQRPERL